MVNNNGYCPRCHDGLLMADYLDEFCLICGYRVSYGGFLYTHRRTRRKGKKERAVRAISERVLSKVGG